MKLRKIIGATALAVLASTAYAQTPAATSSTANSDVNSGMSPSHSGVGATMPTAPATTSNDPFVQKRVEDKAAKKEYKKEKKAAKKDYKQSKKQTKADLKQDLAAHPAKPGEVGQPGEYGQAAAPGMAK